MRDRVTMKKKKPVIVNNLTWGKAVCKEREKVREATYSMTSYMQS